MSFIQEKKPFKKILIANRGEIAARIIKTVQEMGIPAVSVYSDPDQRSPHVWLSDESYPLHGIESSETYLHIEKILDIAKKNECDAIHPGYGFLSENPEFAKACQDSGITFIGPSSKTIAQLGDKLKAKEIAKRAEVPVLPEISVPIGISEDELKKSAERIGYPILIKAAAGGGGKGVRLVKTDEELNQAVESCQREAKSAFGDPRVFFEKYLDHPRHIEIQIFRDDYGNMAYLFERECSIQRRFQKVLEESPSPVLTSSLREKMGEAAKKIAEQAGYTNAGTVEFLLDSSGNFYFLEVNTRLQVEHPVTEMVTLQDLVEWQILIAEHQKLPLKQEQLKLNGHALECRIYAEDPAHDFFPSTGKIEVYEEPVGPNIRIDSGIIKGSEMTIHYDPMLAKLIVWGNTREKTLRRMQKALKRFAILGVVTNIEFLQGLVSHPEFVKGNLSTHFLSENQISFRGNTPDEVLTAAAAFYLAGKNFYQDKKDQPSASLEKKTPWESLGKWRGM